MILCKYQNIFGKPNEGVHSIRLFDYAIIDILFTFIFSYIFSKYIKINIFYIFIFLFLLGQIFHILFCVETKFLKNFYL
jgi:hypothetical protein